MFVESVIAAIGSGCHRCRCAQQAAADQNPMDRGPDIVCFDNLGWPGGHQRKNACCDQGMFRRVVMYLALGFRILSGRYDLRDSGNSGSTDMGNVRWQVMRLWMWLRWLPRRSANGTELLSASRTTIPEKIAVDLINEHGGTSRFLAISLILLRHWLLNPKIERNRQPK